MKTVDGILREMRELAKEVQGNSISNAYELLMGFADRIEAAAKSLEADRDNWRRQELDEAARANATHNDSLVVGDMAAMRKALESALPIMRDCPFTHYNTTEVDKVVEEIESALSSPPRNCDVYIEAQLCEMVTEEIKSEFGTDIPQGIIDIIEIVAKGMIKGLFAEAKGETK